MVVPVETRPWTKMLPTKVPVTLLKVSVPLPAAVPTVDRTATAVDPTLSVTVTGLGGVALSETESRTCMSLPTNTLVMPRLMVGAVTVAVSDCSCEVVLKPAGVAIWTREVPAAAGSNCVLLPRSPPLNTRGLVIEPKLAIGDGALGFWKAVRQVWPTAAEQRCWVHKTANVLDKLPKSVQPKAKEMLHEIYLSPSRAEAEKAFDLFLRTYEAKYPKATECLGKDRKELLAFYDFPAEHWLHLRTTNVIESVFATVRLRTEKTKGSGTRVACLTMVFKLMQSASRHWRALNGSGLLSEVIKGTVFVDGIRKEDAA